MTMDIRTAISLVENSGLRVCYHGTSLVQYEKLRQDGFIARDLYMGESRENITDHYADEQASRDHSYPVTLTLDMSKLSGVRDDVHDTMDGPEDQLGQFIYSGPLQEALISASAYEFNQGEEIELPLDQHSPLPLPLTIT